MKTWSLSQRFVRPLTQQNTRREHNVAVMLGQRLRRWPNITATLSSRLVFARRTPYSNLFQWNSWNVRTVEVDQCAHYISSHILVKWLKLPAWKVGDRGFEPLSGLQVSKKQTVSSPLTREDLKYCAELWWPKGSVFGRRPTGLEFPILCMRAVSSHSSHHPQEVLLAQFSLYVHNGGLKPHSFSFVLSQRS